MITKLSELENLNIQNKTFLEFLKIKKENKDYIVLFQIGDFFETFLEDALAFAGACNVVLGKRTFKTVGLLAQAGVNRRYLDIYIKKLLNKNLKVCVCEQIQIDGEISRIIKRKYTKGTIFENELLETYENNFLATVIENSRVFELSYCDSSCGQFYKTKGDFDEIAQEIFKISPSELLILKSQKSLFENKFENLNITFLDDFDLMDLNSDEILIKYLKDNQKDFFVELKKPLEYEIKSFMQIDFVTRRTLEITKNRRNFKKEGSLFEILNFTKTPMGFRTLKKFLNEPLLDLAQIIKRQNFVSKLVLNKEKLNEIENLLDGICDLSRLCAKLANSTISLKDLYSISLLAKNISALAEVSNSFDHGFSIFAKEKIVPVLELTNFLSNAFDCSKENSINIKENFNSKLDFLRDNLKNEFSKLQTLEEDLKEKTKIENLKISYKPTFGYFVELSNKEAAHVLDFSEFEIFQNNKTTSKFKTKTLIEIQEKIFSLKFQIEEIENSIFKDILDKSKKFVQNIRELSFDIGFLDSMYSFSKCAVEYDLSCPEFFDDGFEVKDCFHPILLKTIEKQEKIIKNDTNFEGKNTIILTGANMSGKSTFLKQNAIVSILAQIGTFVFSKNAKLSIIDRLFFRQSTYDDLLNSKSSFMVEMSDLNFILNNATKNSLVLLDEPLKSTNSKEASAILMAYLEYFSKNYGAKTIIATHNFEITTLEDKFPDEFINYFISFENSNNLDKKEQSRKIKIGRAKESKALDIALALDFPKEIIEKATSYARP